LFFELGAGFTLVVVIGLFTVKVVYSTSMLAAKAMPFKRCQVSHIYVYLLLWNSMRRNNNKEWRSNFERKTTREAANNACVCNDIQEVKSKQELKGERDLHNAR
jgi:hypothetical protein